MGSVSPQEEHSAVFVQGEFSEPMSSEHNFQEQYDLEDPNRAMSDYARYIKIFDHYVLLLTAYRIMHAHTKRQLSTATSPSRRRSQGVSPGSVASVSSTDS